MRHIGIDFGTSKVGVALSDEAGTMGFPHGVLPNDEKLMDALAALIKEKGVGAAVFGESLDFTGSGNPVLAKAHAFANALTAKAGIPAYFEPEMLTTQEAKRGFDGLHPQHASDASRTRGAPGNAGAIDASAAALILTSYLSRHDRA